MYNLKKWKELRMSYSPQALAKAAKDALDYLDNNRATTLFGLVDRELIAQGMTDIELDPLNLVAQEFPQDIASNDRTALHEYVATVTWPEVAEGAVLAEYITFVDEDGQEHEAPLVNAVLRDGQALTLLRLEDGTLRGGDSISPEVRELLSYTLNQ
ncbi:MAG: hypothetical protein Q3972_07905 [Corynebacterium sp.]|nr:hypothetical protein [Corynebacterium sp.]